MSARNNRRTFLAGLAGALAAPAAVAAVPPKAPSPAESGELLALGDRLTALTARHAAAVADLEQAGAALARLMPALPPDLVAPASESARWTQAVMRPDCCGGVMLPDGRPLRIYTAALSQGWLDDHARVSRHAAQIRRVRKNLRLAKRYEADVVEAERGADIVAKRSAVSDVVIEAQSLVEQIIAIEPKTTAGAAIFARAVLATGTVLGRLRAPTYEERLGTVLADAVIRLQKEAAQ